MNQVMTEEQYKILKRLDDVISDLSKQDGDFKEMVGETDILGGNIEDLQGDLERMIDIYGFIKRYQKGELEDAGSITISNNMAVVIVCFDHGITDWVFGYAQFDEGKEFFYSEIEQVQDSEEPTLVTDTFRVGEKGIVLDLADAMRF